MSGILKVIQKFGNPKTHKLVMYCPWCRKDYPVEEVTLGLDVKKPRKLQFIQRKCTECKGNLVRMRA